MPSEGHGDGHTCARGLEETVELRDRCGSLGLMDREVTHEGYSISFCCNKML